MPKRKRDSEIVKYRYDNEIEKYRYKIHKRYINEILAKETAKIIRYSFIFIKTFYLDLNWFYFLVFF